jgi:hypothetical protein
MLHLIHTQFWHDFGNKVRIRNTTVTKRNTQQITHVPANLQVAKMCWGRLKTLTWQNSACTQLGQSIADTGQRLLYWQILDQY